jgi:hypothetical protein
MPQLDLVPLEANVIWISIFVLSYIFVNLSFLLHPVLNLLKANFHLLRNQASQLKLQKYFFKAKLSEKFALSNAIKRLCQVSV